MIRSNCPKNKFLKLIRPSLAEIKFLELFVRRWPSVAVWHRVIIMSRYRACFSDEVKQRRARLVRGWVTDQGLLRMHGFSAKVPRRVTLTDE